MQNGITKLLSLQLISKTKSESTYSSSFMFELIETGSLGLLCIFSRDTGWATSGLGVIFCLRTVWPISLGFLMMGFGAGDSLSSCEICGDNRLNGFFSLSCGDVPKVAESCFTPAGFAGELTDEAWALVWATGAR